MSSNNKLSEHAKWMKLGMRAYLFPGYNRFRRKVIELSGISDFSNMLDFGCGIGLLEEYIKDYLKLFDGKVTGVDTGEELIRIAKSNFQRDADFQFFVIDEDGNLPFADNTFDIIVSNLVFHLLTKEQKQQVFKEFKRVIKPEGQLLLAEIGKPYGLFGYWVKFLTLNLWIRIWPYEKNCIDSFNGLLPGIIRSAGFKRVETVYRMKGYIDFITVKN